MELRQKIKLNKPTPQPNSDTESPQIAIPQKKKVINENSPIIRRLREDEEKAKRQKLSDEELIEQEFKDEANAIRAQALREDLLKDEMQDGDIEEYIKSTQIPLTRNLAELDENNIMPLEHSFVDILQTSANIDLAQSHAPNTTNLSNFTPQNNQNHQSNQSDFFAMEHFDENIVRTPLPKNALDSMPPKPATKQNATNKVDKIDLSDLLPDSQRATLQIKSAQNRRDSQDSQDLRDFVAPNVSPALSPTNTRNINNINEETLYIDFSKDNVSDSKQRDSLQTRNATHESISHKSRESINESIESPIKLSHNKDLESPLGTPYYAEPLPPVFSPNVENLEPNFAQESHENNTAHIIESMAHQSDEVVGIYTPKARDFESGEHSVQIVDKIDGYDIEIPKVRALYDDILGDNNIIDATDDIDALNDISSSLERAQKRLAEKLKVAKMRQNLGDIKSITPIDSEVDSRSDYGAIQNQKPISYESNAMLTRNEIIDRANMAQEARDSNEARNVAQTYESKKPSESPRDFNVPRESNAIPRDLKDEYNENFFDLPQQEMPQKSVNPSVNQGANQSQILQNAPIQSHPSAIQTVNQNTISQNLGDSSAFQLPPLDLLNPPFAQKIDIDDSEIDIKVQNLFNKLRVFKIEGDIVRTYSGPVVTTFEFRPAPNVKVSRIQNLQDDLSMALKATSIRIQAPIPGKDVVGIEIPNNKIQTIYLREVFESDEFKSANAQLPIALGKDVIGNPVIEDLAKLPHLLIAGTTGSGKSVGINAMILSLLYRHTPKDLRFIMIDPKFLEFGLYKDIPHLLTPIITDPKKAIIALSKAVDEMNRRYELMDRAKVKTIVGFNELATQNGEEKLPYIVIIIDEFADLMIMGGREAEQFLISLAGKARASGIHLIIATQRPTVNVVTGLIKGNLPSKISYRVGSKIDSKVILDETGAEALLGRGDMLFSKTNNIVRLHAPYNDEREIERIVEFLKSQQEVIYDEFFSLEAKEPTATPQPTQLSGDTDYKECAKEIILQSGKTSISYLQRGLGVGFNKAANIIESLEKDGFLSPPNSKGVREIIGN